MTVRYDPRDLAEIRVFHRGRFLCRAVNPEHAGRSFTLTDIQAARRERRRTLRNQINERIARVVDFLPGAAQGASSSRPASQSRRPPKLRVYLEDE